MVGSVVLLTEFSFRTKFLVKQLHSVFVNVFKIIRTKRKAKVSEMLENSSGQSLDELIVRPLDTFFPSCIVNYYAVKCRFLFDY